VTVDGKRRVRLVPREHHIDGPANAPEVWMLKGSFLEHGSKSRREQQCVAFSQGYLQSLREAQHHIAARLRAPRLDEAKMLWRDFSIARERELAITSALAPVAQKIAYGFDGGSNGGRHGQSVTAVLPRCNYL
jgi:hypothetical protein